MSWFLFKNFSWGLTILEPSFAYIYEAKPIAKGLGPVESARSTLKLLASCVLCTTYVPLLASLFLIHKMGPTSQNHCKDKT